MSVLTNQLIGWVHVATSDREVIRVIRKKLSLSCQHGVRHKQERFELYRDCLEARRVHRQLIKNFRL